MPRSPGPHTPWSVSAPSCQPISFKASGVIPMPSFHSALMGRWPQLPPGVAAVAGPNLRVRIPTPLTTVAACDRCGLRFAGAAACGLTSRCAHYVRILAFIYRLPRPFSRLPSPRVSLRHLRAQMADVAGEEGNLSRNLRVRAPSYFLLLSAHLARADKHERFRQGCV